MAMGSQGDVGKTQGMDDTGHSGDADRLTGLRDLAAAVSTRVKKIALLYGGTSGEREVSLASGRGVHEVLEGEGFSILLVDTGKPGFVDVLLESRPDVAFIALHGKGGEDGCIQGLLETVGIPYTHSGVEASALAMDKRVSKLLYQAGGLTTARFSVASRDDFGDVVDTGDGQGFVMRGGGRVAADVDALVASVGLPCAVKPLGGGSSLGVSIPKTRDGFVQALGEGFKVDDTLLIEEFVAGVEVTVPVLGNRRQDLFALPVIEIVPKNEFYDYESKYAEGGSEHIIPARIDERETAACKRAAMDAHAALGCAGVSRTDMIVTREGVPYLIETNTVPGMTRTSLIPEDAKKAGISPGELYRLLLYFALERR
jgi:D-alanine-D-alanine ligase